MGHSFMEINLIGSSSISKSYGEGVISVSKNQFLKYTAKCLHLYTSDDGTKKKCRIVVATWFMTRYINYFNYLPVIVIQYGTEREKNPRVENCIFVQI